jgi:hypothetical protein
MQVLLPGAVAHDKAGVQFLDGRGRRVAAFCHGVLSHCYAQSADMLERGEGDAMHHVFTHSFDYIALGILIACMFFAAAKVIPRRNP